MDVSIGKNLNEPNKSFWKNKRVFLTGSTGFKGSWLVVWLNQLGATVEGFALAPEDEQCLFTAAKLSNHVKTTFSDVRDYASLSKSISNFAPDIIIHLAAQPLVLESYKNPVATFQTNVMGTVNLLEAAKNSDSVKVIINVTTDKVYANHEWVWSYRENDALGAKDPYSASKSCSELVTQSYSNSYFKHQTSKTISTARAGNVIGGGDWSKNRLIPDIIRAFKSNNILEIRNPNAKRPWQHVLEPLLGYLKLAEKMYDDGSEFEGAWNFGPRKSDAKPVKWIVNHMKDTYYKTLMVVNGDETSSQESQTLQLDISKAEDMLGWQPRTDIVTALEWVTDFQNGIDGGYKPLDLMIKQIDQFSR